MEERNIETIIDLFYEIISGEKKKERNWNNLKRLFYEEATLCLFIKNKNGDCIARIFRVDQYCERLDMFLRENDFYEKSMKKRITISKDICAVYDEYCAFKDRENKEFVKKGINLISLIRAKEGWKIVNMTWEDIK